VHKLESRPNDATSRWLSVRVHDHQPPKPGTNGQSPLAVLPGGIYGPFPSDLYSSDKHVHPGIVGIYEMIRQIILFVGDLPQDYVTRIHIYNRIYQRLGEKHRVKYHPLKGWLGSDSKRVLYLSLTGSA
jgi:hypothetical protein